MYCPSCENRCIETDSFCMKCGFNLLEYRKNKEINNEKSCPDCSSVCAHSDSACKNCGFPFTTLEKDLVLPQIIEMSTNDEQLNEGISKKSEINGEYKNNSIEPSKSYTFSFKTIGKSLFIVVLIATILFLFIRIFNNSNEISQGRNNISIDTTQQYTPNGNESVKQNRLTNEDSDKINNNNEFEFIDYVGVWNKQNDDGPGGMILIISSDSSASYTNFGGPFTVVFKCKLIDKKINLVYQREDATFKVDDEEYKGKTLATCQLKERHQLIFNVIGNDCPEMEVGVYQLNRGAD